MNAFKDIQVRVAMASPAVRQESFGRPLLLRGPPRRYWKRGQKRNRRQRREGRAESAAFRNEVFTCPRCEEAGQPAAFPRWQWRDLPDGMQSCPKAGHVALLLHLPPEKRAGMEARVRLLRSTRSMLGAMLIGVGD